MGISIIYYILKAYEYIKYKLIAEKEDDKPGKEGGKY